MLVQPVFVESYKIQFSEIKTNNNAKINIYVFYLSRCVACN